NMRDNEVRKLPNDNEVFLLPNDKMHVLPQFNMRDNEVRKLPNDNEVFLLPAYGDHEHSDNQVHQLPYNDSETRHVSDVPVCVTATS
ncbi:MAG: hypothetical protein ACXV5N_12815, partial [Halobacteriota archaeon]